MEPPAPIDLVVLSLVSRGVPLSAVAHQTGLTEADTSRSLERVARRLAIAPVPAQRAPVSVALLNAS